MCILTGVVCPDGSPPDVFDDKIDGFETGVENGEVTPDNKISTVDGENDLIFNYNITNPEMADTFPMTFETTVDTKTDGPFDVTFILQPEDGGDPIIFTVSISITFY